jgi:hypothetical protein
VLLRGPVPVYVALRPVASNAPLLRGSQWFQPSGDGEDSPYKHQDKGLVKPIPRIPIGLLRILRNQAPTTHDVAPSESDAF